MVFTSPSAGPPGTKAPIGLERSRPRIRPAVSTRLSSSTAFGKTYDDLQTRKMTASERRNLKERLLNEWADTDPAGFLSFLERKRVWPRGLMLGSMVKNLSTSRPDLLLDFVLRTGCQNTLQFLKFGDTVTMARLIEALPAEAKGPELLVALAEIYQEMGRTGIDTANPNSAYFRGVADARLREGRLDDFFAAFEKIDNADARKELADELGSSLSDEKPGDKILEWLFRLPAECQNTAVSRMLAGSGGIVMAFPEAREARRQWIGILAENGFAKGAANGVSDLLSADDERVPGELVAWLATFPSDDSWKPIADRVFLSWSQNDPDAMIREVCAMPEGPLREKLAVLAADGLRAGGMSDRQTRLDRLMNLIPDAEIRKRYEESGNPPDGSEVDPFAEP